MQSVLSIVRGSCDYAGVGPDVTLQLQLKMFKVTFNTVILWLAYYFDGLAFRSSLNARPRISSICVPIG